VRGEKRESVPAVRSCHRYQNRCVVAPIKVPCPPLNPCPRMDFGCVCAWECGDHKGRVPRPRGVAAPAGRDAGTRKEAASHAKARRRGRVLEKSLEAREREGMARMDAPAGVQYGGESRSTACVCVSL